MKQMRLTQRQKGSEEARAQIFRTLAASIDCYPNHLSETSAALLGSDASYIYCELDRFEQKIRKLEAPKRGRPRKKEIKVYESTGTA